MTRGKKNPAENNASSYLRFINLWKEKKNVCCTSRRNEIKQNKQTKRKVWRLMNARQRSSAWKSASKCNLLFLLAGLVLNPKSYINCSKYKSKSACILFHSSTRTSPACQKVHLCYKVDQLTMLRKPLLSQRYMQSNLWHQCCDTAAAVLDAKRLQLSSCFAFTLLAFTHCSVSFSLVVWFCLNSKLLG